MKVEEYKKNFKKGQLLGAIVFIIFLIWFSKYLHSPKLIFGLIAGIGFGYTLTRARFGFAGGIKRIYNKGEGSLTKALLISFAVTALIYAVVQWSAKVNGAIPAFLAKNGEAVIPGTQNVFMINIGTIVGGFLFGVGMVIAGGCASGTLVNFGEGDGHAFIAFPLFVLGTIPGHYLREVIDRNPIGKVGGRVYLPDYFGYLGALLVTVLGLIVLYVFTKRYENIRKKEGTYIKPNSDYNELEKPLVEEQNSNLWIYALYHKLFVERWSFKTGALLLSVISGCYIIFNQKAWGVTGAFTTMAVWFVGLFGIHFDDVAFNSVYKALSNGVLGNAGVILDIGIIFGALLSFLLSGRFKLKFKFNASSAFLFGLGGLLMGFGSRLAKGCNIAALYSSLPNFSLSGWVFLLVISLGAVVGLKLFKGKTCMVPNNPGRRKKI